MRDGEKTVRNRGGGKAVILFNLRYLFYVSPLGQVENWKVGTIPKTAQEIGRIRRMLIIGGT